MEPGASRCGSQVRSGHRSGELQLDQLLVGPAELVQDLIGVLGELRRARDRGRGLVELHWASPVSACSTLITSAPQSARTAPAAGTNVNCATSRTRTPSIGRSISGLPPGR